MHRSPRRRSRGDTRPSPRSRHATLRSRAETLRPPPVPRLRTAPPRRLTAVRGRRLSRPALARLRRATGSGQESGQFVEPRPALVPAAARTRPRPGPARRAGRPSRPCCPGCRRPRRTTVFLDTDPEALPPRRQDRLSGPRRGCSLQAPGDDDGEPLERARPASSPSSAIRTPAAAHCRRPRRASRPRTTRATASAMVGPTPSTAASSLGARPRGSARSTGSAWARARAAVGPTWRIDSATSTRHSGWDLALSRLSSSLPPLADSSPSLRVNSGAPRSCSSVRSNRSPSSAAPRPPSSSGDRRLVAQRLDVEGAAAGDVEQPLAQLGRAGPGVGAADVVVALPLRR